MEMLLLWVGRLSGGAGVLLLAFSVASRLSGRFIVGGVQVGTWMLLAVAAMVLGCLAYVALMAERRRG